MDWKEIHAAFLLTGNCAGKNAGRKGGQENEGNQI